MSNGIVRLVLYHRYGGHLCDDMLDRLRDLQADWDFELEVHRAWTRTPPCSNTTAIRYPY